MRAPEVEFVPGDRNTGVAANEPTRAQDVHGPWSIEITNWDERISLPTFVSTAEAGRSAASTLDDEDLAFVQASRDRLASQFDKNA